MMTALKSTDLIQEEHRYILPEMKNKTSAVCGLRFETSSIKVIAVTFLLVIFIALGIWQLDRAREKQELRDQLLSRAELPPVAEALAPRRPRYT